MVPRSVTWTGELSGIVLYTVPFQILRHSLSYITLAIVGGNMSQINVIGRIDDDSTDTRAQCKVVSSVSIPFEGAAIGEIQAVRLVSTDCEDRGGCVLKVTLRNGASSFLPFAKNIDGGVELHMAGDIEARALLAALRALLASDV